MSADGAVGAEARRWIRRVRQLGERAERLAAGACVVEGIRAVRAALEAGLPFEAVLVCPERLHSQVGRRTAEAIAATGASRVALGPAAFARVSDMDNPVGLAAIVRWAPAALADLPRPGPAALVLITEDLGDSGNLGTILRSADAAAATAVVVAGRGTDAAHRRCLRASLGTAFRLPVAAAAEAAEALAWARAAGLRTVATSTHAAAPIWDADLSPPLAVAVGSEERGLRAETAASCDAAVAIPMLGSATSLNVAVAAGIALFEVRRRGHAR